MSAYGLMYAATGDELFRLKGDSIVAVLGKVQDALGNGYVSAFPEELINRNLRGEGYGHPGIRSTRFCRDSSTSISTAATVRRSKSP